MTNTYFCLGSFIHFFLNLNPTIVRYFRNLSCQLSACLCRICIDIRILVSPGSACQVESLQFLNHCIPVGIIHVPLKLLTKLFVEVFGMVGKIGISEKGFKLRQPILQDLRAHDLLFGVHLCKSELSNRLSKFVSFLGPTNNRNYHNDTCNES
ncbi:hypothetical protein BDZ45DRAFT_682049 [Acephala macrosclerotiorum]|nr:hypothetical protein BDZ45DRAFT_682049 [Acephala macrosclerotiorum]